MMKRPDPWARIMAARVLVRLGDADAASALIDDVLAFKHLPPGSYGELFRDIGTPRVPTKLIALFRRSRGDDRVRVLKVIAEHRDATYLDFLGPLLDDRDPRIRRIAVRTLGDIVLRADPAAETRLVSLQGKDLVPLKGLLLWLFNGKALRAEDRLHWRRDAFEALDGAALVVSPYEYVLFEAAGARLQRFAMKRKEMGAHFSHALRSLNDPESAHGSLKWIAYRDYLRIHLDLHGRGVHYLFRKRAGAWEPVGVADEWIS